MTHDEKIVEAVARAIADHFHKDADFGMDGASAYAARPREFQSTARAAITAYQAEAWQDISTAPTDGRFAIAYRPLAHMSRDEPVALKRMIGGNNHCWPSTVPEGAEPTNPTDGSCHATHWQPLPNPPASP